MIIKLWKNAIYGSHMFFLLLFVFVFSRLFYMSCCLFVMCLFYFICFAFVKNTFFSLLLSKVSIRLKLDPNTISSCYSRLCFRFVGVMINFAILPVIFYTARTVAISLSAVSLFSFVFSSIVSFLKTCKFIKFITFL